MRYVVLVLSLQISIHAPLTGSDRVIFVASLDKTYFNPRSPYGERLKAPILYDAAEMISIHAPLTGSDEKSLT